MDDEDSVSELSKSHYGRGVGSEIGQRGVGVEGDGGSIQHP